MGQERARERVPQRPILSSAVEGTAKKNSASASSTNIKAPPLQDAALSYKI